MVFASLLTILLISSGGDAAPPHSSYEETSGESDAIRALSEWVALAVEERPELRSLAISRVGLSQEESKRATQILWDDLQQRLRRERRDEWESRVIRIGDLEMPFEFNVFGEPPEGGRNLFLSMHGGGGAPKRVNDRQWQNQIRLYEPEEGVYLAPRAPTDTWNLWHQAHIDAFLDRIIEDAVLFEGVNPDRVYLMGYSAGGDGVFQLAPRMADRFAAAAMMAGHPNETSPLGLRNLPFTLHMGADDAAYNRNQVAATWKTELAELHAADPSGYDHWVEIHEGKGHWMDREDAAAIPWMTMRTRQRFPTRVVWKQDDVRHDRFYWLHMDAQSQPDRALVIAAIADQTVSLAQSDAGQLTIRLNDSLVDLDRPIVVRNPEGKEVFRGSLPRTISTIAATLAERNDPTATFCSEVAVTVEP